ncbi:hypothetical protein Taro_013315 [Colocasia esculenta]|uniref:Uncharacterized protein n=1 Tax=Colocasia esculenta TaxID=4460 RepID=A0A843UBI6_COLES|nr:hypothetical protein [Colocasia esculenta]
MPPSLHYRSTLLQSRHQGGAICRHPFLTHKSSKNPCHIIDVPRWLIIIKLAFFDHDILFIALIGHFAWPRTEKAEKATTLMSL